MRDDDVLTLLCGDILLQPPPKRQPLVVRAGAAVGLELLDLLLSPDHVLRVTEELTLRNSLVLARHVTVDISLDRMSRQQEEGAARLSALISDRVDLDAEDTFGGSDVGRAATEASEASEPTEPAMRPPRGRLWVPLDSVPRPVPVPVEVTAMDGTILPRPTQHEVKRALDAALYHILSESLRACPDFDREGTPINVVVRSDHLALWLMQSALLSIASITPQAAYWDACAAEVRQRLGGVDLTAVTGDERCHALTALAADPEILPSRRRAIEAIRDAFADDAPFFELVRLVHESYFVVVGLDRSRREQSVRFDLPESEALDTSVATRFGKRIRRRLDPREHNYTAHVLVPLPDNVRQYSLPVSAPSEDGVDSHSEVSLIGAVHFDDHPGRPAMDTLVTCAHELEEDLSADDAAAAGPSDARAMEVGFLARRATAAVDHLDAIVHEQKLASDEWEDRWGRASTWTVQRSIETVRAVARVARDQLQVARDELQQTVSAADGRRVTSERLRRASTALRGATAAVDHHLLRTRLVSNELAGQDVARIRLGRPSLLSPSQPRARTLEVWATFSDEAVPFETSAVVPPVGLALFIYVTGRLVFDSWLWMWPFSLLWLPSATLTTGGADAIVAVLLLIPAFAVTQIQVPDRWSVAGRLRRPARKFVQMAIVALGAIAMVVATQVGTSTPDGGGGHPHLVLWTFRGALVYFVAWSAWALVAWGLRRRYSWRPKGLKSYIGREALVRVEPPSHRARRIWEWTAPRLGWLVRVVRIFRYDIKAPDVEFDLSLSARAFPSHRRSPQEAS